MYTCCCLPEEYSFCPYCSVQSLQQQKKIRQWWININHQRSKEKVDNNQKKKKKNDCNKTAIYHLFMFTFMAKFYYITCDSLSFSLIRQMKLIIRIRKKVENYCFHFFLLTFFNYTNGPNFFLLIFRFFFIYFHNYHHYIIWWFNGGWTLYIYSIHSGHCHCIHILLVTIPCTTSFISICYTIFKLEYGSTTN